MFVAAGLLIGGCYGGKRATRDNNDAWRGRTKATLVSTWGRPATVANQGGQTVLRWTRKGHRVTLPSGKASIRVHDRGFEASGVFRPGSIRAVYTHTDVTIGADGTVLEVRGPSLRRGRPPGANLRWGFLFGFHAGMGRLDDTGTPLPSGGLYIGGMLGPRLGLVGSFDLVAGKDTEGGALGLVWSLGAKYWVDARTSVRAGPAAVLAFDPGFEDAGFSPGVAGSVSYALLRGRAFVLDLRLDATAATAVTMGTLGIGVNIN